MAIKKITQFFKWGTDLNGVLKKGNRNGSGALKEIVNVLSHQRKANKNCLEIYSYTNQNGQDQ